MKTCGNCVNYVWGDRLTPVPPVCLLCVWVAGTQGEEPSNWKPKPEIGASGIQATRSARTEHDGSSPKKVIDPAPIIKELADWCLVAKGLECSILGSVIDKLRAAPAVKFAEERHGRWIPVPSSDMTTGKAYKCSECGKMRYGSFMPNYCQNCGAKMGEERRTDGA